MPGPEESPTSPPPAARRRRKWLVGGVALLVVLLAIVAYASSINEPAYYDSIDEHFKYGTIGSDEPYRGLPRAVLEVLPEVFPEYLPPGAPRDYTAFGFIQEPGHTLPIGFSKRRRLGIDLMGLNCSVCHVTTVREAPGSPARLYLGTPANTVDLEAFFEFLFNCGGDERFTPDTLLAAIDAREDLNPLERWVLRERAIPLLRENLIAQRERLSILFAPDRPRSGPGRVDTFNPYKTLIFNFPTSRTPREELLGASDLPSIWNQGPRHGLNLHWDGNNSSVHERNLSAAFGAGATPVTVDLESLARLEDWLEELPPPPYPFPIDRTLAEAGARVYRQHCYSCHAERNFGPGSQERAETRVGQVVPLESIGTDPYRLLSFTHALAVHQGTLMAYREDQRLKHFRTTNGYTSMPLDGLWLRAPYLHNGSVPTLRDLLTPARERPTSFYRGHDVYDPVAVGFVSNVPAEGDRRFFLYRTRDERTGRVLPGNSNQGHEYGTQLSEPEKQQLLEFLKTL